MVMKYCNTYFVLVSLKLQISTLCCTFLYAAASSSCIISPFQFLSKGQVVITSLICWEKHLDFTGKKSRIGPRPCPAAGQARCHVNAAQTHSMAHRSVAHVDQVRMGTQPRQRVWPSAHLACSPRGPLWAQSMGGLAQSTRGWHGPWVLHAV